jgi:hypothetical protein
MNFDQSWWSVKQKIKHSISIMTRTREQGHKPRHNVILRGESNNVKMSS